MSRSHKKTPYLPVACCSERISKKIWHKKWRSREHSQLSSLEEDQFDDYQSVHYRDVSDPWNMQKDGKLFYHELSKKNPVKNRRWYHRMGK